MIIHIKYLSMSIYCRSFLKKDCSCGPSTQAEVVTRLTLKYRIKINMRQCQICLIMTDAVCKSMKYAGGLHHCAMTRHVSSFIFLLYFIFK